MKITRLFLKGLLLSFFAIGSVNALATDTIRFTWEGASFKYISLLATAGGQFTIDWGDGIDSIYTVPNNNSIQPNHKYADVNNYTVTIAAITENFCFMELNCANSQLSSLDISKCKTLQYLSCHFNQLTTLDLNANTGLETLQCNNNQLNSLDISHNVSLTELYCHNNLLTNLKTGNYINTVLLYLYCNNNQLNSLDLSNYTALKTLSCENNQLNSLKINNNKSLTYLHCNNNQLSSLDLSTCPNLWELRCNNNQLGSLDLSGCMVLVTLNCDNNNLIILDISENKNTSLMGLNLSCRNNQLSSLILNNDTAFIANLYCNDNYLLLSELYTASQKVMEFGMKYLGTQRLLLQTITVGDVIDFSSQAFFGNPDTATVFMIEKDSLPAIKNVDYGDDNGIITFNNAGNYTITMINDAIVSDTNYPAKVIATVNVSGVGTIENILPEIKVYPNPTNGKLRIENGEWENIEILDVMGRKQKVESKTKNEIDIAHLPAGIYFLQIETEKGTITKKIIKK